MKEIVGYNALEGELFFGKARSLQSVDWQAFKQWLNGPFSACESGVEWPRQPRQCPPGHRGVHLDDVLLVLVR